MLSNVNVKLLVATKNIGFGVEERSNAKESSRFVLPKLPPTAGWEEAIMGHELCDTEMPFSACAIFDIHAAKTDNAACTYLYTRSYITRLVTTTSLHFFFLVKYSAYHSHINQI